MAAPEFKLKRFKQITAWKNPQNEWLANLQSLMGFLFALMYLLVTNRTRGSFYPEAPFLAETLGFLFVG